MWQELFSTYSAAIVIGVCIAVTAMGDEIEKPKSTRAKKQYSFMVNGKKFDKKIDAMREIFASGSETVLKCSEIKVETLIK